MSWDFDNKLASADIDANGTADVSFQYDALGRRVARTGAGGSFVFVQMDQQTIADYPVGGAAIDPNDGYKNCVSISKNMRIDMPSRILARGVVVVAGFPIPYVLKSGWNINYRLVVKECEKCCGNGQVITEELISGDVSAFARVEGTLGFDIDQPVPTGGKLKGYIGIRGEIGMEFTASFGGKTDKRHGDADLGGVFCASARGRGVLRGGGSIRYQRRWWSYDLIAVEGFGSISTGGKACFRYGKDGVTHESTSIDEIYVSGGFRGCAFGVCVTRSVEGQLL